MIIQIEKRFCKVANVFSEMLNTVQRAAERGDAVHEVEELTLSSLLEMGRQTVLAYIQEQKEELPRPQVIEHEGRTLHRLPEQRTRPYVSAFGPTPFEREVYATRETQRQEVVPLDAKLGMPQSDTSYLLQKWSGAQFVKESYKESRVTLESILGFAPSVNCLEDMAAPASQHAEPTSSNKPRSMRRQRSRDPCRHQRLQRRADAQGRCAVREASRSRRTATAETPQEGREERAETDGVRGRCLLGGPLSSHGRGRAQ